MLERFKDLPGFLLGALVISGHRPAEIHQFRPAFARDIHELQAARSGTHNGRSGTSTRGQQPNGCRALRRSGG